MSRLASGIQIAGIGMQQVLHSVSLGIALGLFAGKQIGVFGFCWCAIRLGYAELPKRGSWPTLWSNILREFFVHAGAELNGVFLVHGYFRHALDRIAVKRHKFLNDFYCAFV